MTPMRLLIILATTLLLASCGSGDPKMERVWKSHQPVLIERSNAGLELYAWSPEAGGLYYFIPNTTTIVPGKYTQMVTAGATPVLGDEKAIAAWQKLTPEERKSLNLPVEMNPAMRGYMKLSPDERSALGITVPK